MQLLNLPEQTEVEPLLVNYDGFDAVECFTKYLSDAWIYGFDGIVGFDSVTALAVIDKLKPKADAQLRLLARVKAFAAGVLKHINEQREQHRSNQ